MTMPRRNRKRCVRTAPRGGTGDRCWFRWRWSIGLLLLAALGAPCSAQVPATAPATASGQRLHFVEGKDWAPLPYESAHGEILFAAVIDDRPVTILLDNGTERTVIDRDFLRRAGIAVTQSPARAKTSGGDSLATGVTGRDLTLAAAKAFTLTGTFATIDLQPISIALGRRVDAILGADVLDHFAIMVQPQTKQLSLAPSGSIKASAGSVVLPLQPGGTVVAQIDGQPAVLKVDYGFSGVVRLTDTRWRALFPEGGGEISTQTGANGVERQTNARRATLALGRLTAREVPVENGYRTDRPVDGLVGNGLLGRVTSVLDMQRATLILVP